MLHTELSFSIYDKFDEGTDQNEDIKEKMERTVTIGEKIEAEFSFGSDTNYAMDMIEEDNNADEEKGGGKDDRIEEFKVVINGEVKEIEFEQSNSGELDKFYEEMVCAHPSNPLLLKNYAQFLESKGEFASAEEYYYRATLADSTNGEILYRYAKLVWELHRDQERALTYFKKAALAAPEDSHILAAYASFLWEIDEDEEEGNLFSTQVCENGELGDVKVKDSEGEKTPTSPPLHLAMGQLGIFKTSLGSVDYKKPELSEGTSIEEYYRRMLEENSCNPLFLKNYDQFLLQSKGYLQGAEEYYLRAIVEDPSNGQTMSQYANLLWQLHRDKDRADGYFNKAIKATSEDSDMLASYAKFLWETEDEEEDSAVQAANNQFKGDVEGAEEYYLRAILEDPSNGGIMSQYATLLWEVHGDKDRADEYFKQAIQATPGDSDVLASYAMFLWEIEDEEEDSI